MKVKLWLAIMIMIMTGSPSSGQDGFSLKIDLQMVKFNGKGALGTSYLPTFGYQSFTPQYGFNFNDADRFFLIVDFGFGVIGTKQIKYDGEKTNVKIYGIHNGWFLRYNILDPEMTPYAIAGINLEALFANHPSMMILQPDGTYKQDYLDHRVFFPEVCFGAGFTFFNGMLSVEITDKIGLVSVDKAKTLKSNVISVGLITHIGNL